MSGRYLTDLADVIRGAGLGVIEVDGWQTRARSSGGYSSGRPTHIMVHHTASGPSSDGWPDVDYMCFGSENRPVANLYLDRQGTVFVMAAGATNTNGSGHDSWGGGVPTDSMNTYAIGIEAGNGGTGEAWPAAQQDAYQVLCSVLCAHYLISTEHVRAHFEWAPDRKVDPAGPSQWSNPSGGGSANMWRMNEYRGDLGSLPTPPPNVEDDDMAVVLSSSNGDATQRAAQFAWSGTGIAWITSDAQLAVGRITGLFKFDGDGNPLRNFDVAGIQDLIDRLWSGGPVPPGWSEPRYRGTSA